MTKLQKIELALSKGKIGGAKALLKIFLLQEDKNKFYSDMRNVYDELYPKNRTCENWQDYMDSYPLISVENKYSEEDYNKLADKGIPYPTVTIGYSEDENYLSFEDYKNETKVITEAVAEELDEDGNVVTEAVEEVREPMRGYTAVDVTDRVEAYGPLVSKMTEITEAKYQSQADALVVGYSKFEVESFGVQEAEANAYKADDTAVTPLLDALVASRGIGKDVLADKILEKSGMFKVAIGTLLGAKQKELG